MKKLNKLFAILIAVLGVSATAKADTSILKESDGWQKITALPSNLGDYYFALVDKNNDLMLTMAPGANQGGEFYTMYYRKSANPLQHKASLWTIEGTNYTFRNVEYTKFAMQTEWNAAWYYRTHDQPNPCEWTATTPVYSPQEACWTIQNGKYPNSGYLGPWNEANFADGAEVAFNKSGNNIGKFHIYSIPKTYCKDVAANATSANPVDMSVLITNSDAALAVIGMGGWTTANTITRNNNSGYDGKSGFFEFCNWGASSWEGSMTQTISSLPIGKYKVRAAGQASATDVVLTLTANGVSTNLNCIGAKGGNISADGSEVSSGSGVAGWQYMEVECVVVDGNLSISAYSKGTATQRWANIDNFSIYYCGKDLTIYENALSSKITAAKAIDDTKLNTYVKNYLATEIAAAENALKDASRTVESLEKQAEQLDAAVKSADEIVVPYTNTLSLISSCENIVNNSDEMTSGAKNELTDAINAAKENVENATTADAINGIYNTLEVARQTYVRVAEPLNGIKFDYTFMVINPGFDNEKEGWTHNTSAANNGIANNQGGAITGKYYENWDSNSYTGEIYQELTGLPSGKYILTAAAFRDQLIGGASGGDAVYVFANENETLVTSGTPALYSVEVSITSGSLTFGVKSKVKKYRWMGIDNVSLQYVEGLGLTEFINAYNAALAAATAARDDEAYSNVAGVEKAALLAAIASQPDQTQLESLESAIAALQSATATFIAAKNSYDLLAVEQQTAKGLGMTNTLIEEIINNKTGLIALQDLKVAEYNYVTSEFSYPVKLSETWNTEGPVGTLYDQHWSGQNSPYLEQSSAAWSSSAWEISYDQDLTLPAGEYVFKVAGRKASGDGCTLSLIVTKGDATLGTVNDFPEGDTGYGIDTNGKTNFSEDGTYANNNAGRAWQWRYVKFTLDSEATVNIAVKAKATTNHQWISFCDATVQMTEETYLEANMGGLDAPTAAANSLLGDKKPMGTTEATALQNALNMSVNTGADLLAKIEALEEAIANANEWVTAYNNAKPVLVAALDRFEADYNDAEKGALNHMNKSRWTTAINMAQAAAVAKDVLNSYDGFETAAKNLNDALDEATTSINEYAALISAIDNANTLANGGNWGDQPFQRPISAKENLNTTTAQATYEAAEAEGEGVTSVTTALNNGLNGIALNEPKDGTCYKIVMGDLTWTNNDNATMLSTKDKSLVFVKGGQDEAQGLYSINFIGKNNNYAHALIFNAVKDKINQYTISFIDNDGATRYICDGSVTGAGTGVYGIRTTTDAAKALPVEVRATATEGVWNLYNTVAKELLGAQDAGFYTTARNNNLKIMEAPKNEVTLTFSKVGWATLILPFNAELPEGVKAYSCGEANGETLTLEEAESIKANTPYLMNGQESTHEFSGYGLADKDSYTVGLFTGTYVEYQTEAGKGTYVLQNIDGDVAFYLVNSKLPKVGAYRCYMTYEASAGAPKFSFGRGEGTTSIDNMESTANSQQPIVIYDLLGRKVNTMEKGGIYIVNGKKVIVK